MLNASTRPRRRIWSVITGFSNVGDIGDLNQSSVGGVGT